MGGLCCGKKDGGRRGSYFSFLFFHFFKFLLFCGVFNRSRVRVLLFFLLFYYKVIPCLGNWVDFFSVSRSFFVIIFLGPVGIFVTIVICIVEIVVFK